MRRIKYPNGNVATRSKRYGVLKAKAKPKSKYHARKTVVDGIEFDSKAEAAYYYQLKTLKLDFKCQEPFEICPKFRLNDKTYRHRTYRPDFSIYENGELVSVVDVKGGKATVTTDSRLRMVLFMNQYQVPVVLARYNYRQKTFEEVIA